MYAVRIYVKIQPYVQPNVAWYKHRIKYSPSAKDIYFWSNSPTWARVATFVRFLDHNDTPVGRTPLDEGSARRRDLYLKTHNTDKRQTSMAPAGFEPAIPAGDRPQTLAVDRSATGIGSC